MADNKLVKEITSMDEDFAKWYTDIVIKAELIDYSSVRGCMVIRPYGYAIWELIQEELNRRFKKTGHQNVYMPMFIPESLLQKEKDHVEGFAPEVAWVTHGGNEKLEERMCVRPTSETLFCEHYKSIVHSYRDLPKLYNQWCSVVRWEKTTRPFLRSREFLWQEGHTIHASAQEAREETERMLNTYADFAEECLAMPAMAAAPMDADDWGQLMKSLDAGFSETLLKLIDRTGKKDSEIYKKANVDRKLFSKIRNNMDYKPSKTTALAFAIALELDIDETKDFIGRAGFALSHSSKFDVIVEYFLVNRNYNVFELNEVLFAFDQPLIGA